MIYMDWYRKNPKQSTEWKKQDWHGMSITNILRTYKNKQVKIDKIHV